MKNIKLGTAAVIFMSFGLLFTSCKENKNVKGQEQMEKQNKEMNQKHVNHGAMEHNGNESGTASVGNESLKKIEFKDESTSKAFQHYMHIKTALVNSDFKEVKNGAKMLATGLDGSRSNIKDLAEKIAVSNELEEQRLLFSELSGEMEMMVKGALKSGEVYKQYCPMAFDNKGASWLANSKKIMNPYFGDKMLHCGTTKEILQ